VDVNYIWAGSKLGRLAQHVLGRDLERPRADWALTDARLASALSRAKRAVAVVLTDRSVQDIAHGVYVTYEPFASIVVGIGCRPGEVTIACTDHLGPELLPFLHELHELSKQGQLAPILERVAQEIETKW
jgi:hypothetical protein